MTQAKLATMTILVAASLALAGAFARVDDPKPSNAKMGSADVASKAKAKSPAPALATPAPASRDQIHLRGRVVDSKGRPVPNAKLVFPLDDPDHPMPESSSGPDGLFSVRVPIKPLWRAVAEAAGELPWVNASAPGFGPTAASADLQTAETEELTVRLAQGGLPVEGRVVDLEGRPVVGARVHVKTLYMAEQRDLDTWIREFEAGRHFNIGNGLAGFPVNGPDATTDRDGRFRLAEVGAGRIAEAYLSGPTIATSTLYIATRDGEGKHLSGVKSFKRNQLIYDRRMEFAAMPTNPIEGIIRDKDSGRPIPNVTLRGSILDEPMFRHLEIAEVIAKTDGEGRYRLAGLPRAKGYGLLLQPGPGLAYTRAYFKVKSDSPAQAAIRHDIALKRGILVRGRLTDKATGKPIWGNVDGFSFRNNPWIKEYPGFNSDVQLTYPPMSKDGGFEVVMLPGRGLIAARCDTSRYRRAIGIEAISGFDRKAGRFDTVPESYHIGNYNVFAEVNLAPGLETTTLDLQADPGRTLTIRAIDPEGKPIGRNKVRGLSELFPTEEVVRHQSTFEMHSLDPSSPRRLTVANVERKLIGSAYLKGDEPAPHTLRLQPWGTITGRIVDDEGQTRLGLSISSSVDWFAPNQDAIGILPDSDWNGGHLIGDDGRFRIEALVPGLKYGADVSENFHHAGHLFDGVIVAPGEVKDLGELKFIPPKP